MVLSKSKSIETGMDVLVALLYAPGATGKPGEEIRGITRFEKLLFLLGRETLFQQYQSEDFKFEAYDYGPFSVEVFDHLEALKDAGIIETRIVESKHRTESLDALEIESDVITDDSVFDILTDDTKKLNIYKLTSRGMIIGKTLYESSTDRERRRLREIKTRFNSMSLHKLLRYIYTKYPEQARESVIKEEVLG